MWRCQLLLAATLASVAMISGPAVLVGQAVEPGEEAYLNVVAAQFGVPPSEVGLLAEDDLATDELPVLLRISNASGIPPAAILAQRRAGDPWLQIARRYGLGAPLFHMPIAPEEAGPILSRAQRTFAETPPSAWGGIDLSHDEIVALENVRVLSIASGASAGEILGARSEGVSFVDAFRALAAVR